MIGERTAEQIKINIGNAFLKLKEEYMEVREGTHNRTPKNVTLSSTEINEALKEPINAIIDAIKFTLENAPELAADIMDKGIMLAGGGAS